MPFLYSLALVARRLAMATATAIATLLPLQTQHASSAGAPQFTPRPANCQNTSGPFDTWLSAFKVEAHKRGVRAQTLQSALNGISYDQQIIYIDRGQSFFAQSFLDFQGKLASNNRLQNGLTQMKKHAGTFQRAEAEFGVPAAIITAFWALESDFGAGIGKRPVLRSLVTLAWDCRRGEMFREELHAALAIIDRGDLVPEEMISSWAGELGQTQFLPTHYLKNAVDYDGDGKRNLFKSAPDVIGSTGNFIRSLGWVKGQPWLEEVRVPAQMPWEQAGLDVKLARTAWAKLGVTKANGQPLASDGLEASLILLQGRGGPAFLAYPNFKIFTEWNQSLNYATTAAYLATRLDGAGPMSRGPAPGAPLSIEQLKELQGLLARGGYGDVGAIDGKLGYATRAAIRQAQLKLGQPADAYPTLDLIARLQGRRP